MIDAKTETAEPVLNTLASYTKIAGNWTSFFACNYCILAQDFLRRIKIIAFKHVKLILDLLDSLKWRRKSMIATAGAQFLIFLFLRVCAEIWALIYYRGGCPSSLI